MTIPRREPESLYYPVIAIIAGLLLLLVAEIPTIPIPVRTWMIQGTSTGFLLLLALRRTFADNMRFALVRGLNVFILALLIWSGVSFAQSPFRGYAATEMLRVLSSAAAYFLCAYSLPRDKQLYALALGFVTLGVVTALYDFFQFSQMQGGGTGTIGLTYGLLGTHEIIGSLLILMLPIALVFAISDEVDVRPRIAAQAATLILGTALLLARTRTAWVAAVIALFFLAFLFLRYARKPEKKARTSRRRKGLGRLNSEWLGSPIALLAVGFALLIGFGGIAPLLSSRLKSVNVLEDASFQDRVHRWKANARMTLERPVMGWGLGASTVMGGRWTHEGDEIVEALAHGTGHGNLAHNYYVQWSADTGIIGLTLYVAVLIAFILTALRSLSTIAEPTKRLIVMGCIATVAASLADSFASPGYNFHGISALLWACMGIGVAAMRGSDRQKERTPALPRTPFSTWVAAPFVGMLASASVLLVGYQQQREGKLQPYGTFQIRPVLLDSKGNETEIIKPVPVSTSVTWIARFHDGSGKEHATRPGTTWTLIGDPAVLSKAELSFLPLILPNEPPLASIQLRTQPTKEPFIATATYWDDYGRRYDAAARIEVEKQGK